MTSLALACKLNAVNAPRSRVAKMVAALRRLGGTLFYVPDNALGDSAPNLLSAPEFAGGLVDAPVRGGLVTASTLAGYDGAIAFGHDGTTGSYAYKGFTYTNGLAYTLSVIVKMDDGNAPTFATVNDGTNPTNSFAVVVGGDVINPTLLTSVAQPDGTYRVSGTWVSTGAGTNTGIVKYGTNNTRTFKVTGYKLELGSVATAYTPQVVLRQRGVYVDNVGTTPVTAVGDLIGLITDKSYGGQLGVELVTTPNISLSAGIGIGIGPALVAGKTYQVAFTVSGYTGTGDCGLDAPTFIATTGVTRLSGNGAARGIVVAAGGPVIGLFTRVSNSATFSNISVRELTGNHATQSAVASKPSVQRVPKRLGPNLVTAGDGSSLTPWAGSVGYTVTAGAFKCNGSTAAPILKQVVGAQQGKTYRVTFIQAGRTAGNSYIVLGGTQPVGAPNLIANQTYTFDLTPSNASGELSFATPSGTFDGSFDNITVQEVLEWATVISFDGSNDFLQTGITTGNEGWICAGVTFTTNPDAYEAIFYAGVPDTAKKSVYLVKGNQSFNGRKILFAISDGTTRYLVNAPQTISAATPIVADCGWSTSQRFVAVNGSETVEAGTNTYGPSAGTLQIGSFFGTNVLNGPMYAAVYCPILPDAADRATIRNGIAALQGRTL